MQSVYLVCGVSGSGKTYACKQVADKFHYIAHDEHYKDHLAVVVKAAKTADKPIVTECPFGERVLREELEKAGVKVIPVFVIEPAHVVAKRYLDREKKMLPQNAWTRATTILNRAIEWKAFHGKSDEVASHLKLLAYRDSL